MNFRNLLVVFFSLSTTLTSYALTPGAQRLVGYETRANAAGARSNKPIPMPHIEIPVEYVGINFAKRLDQKIAASLIFEKNGKYFVRWILNPEDTKWGKELVNHLSLLGLKVEIKNQFIGYQTASRSYIVEDPATGAMFSVKSSTNVTGGFWRDKKQPVGEARDSRLMSDFLYEQNKLRPFEYFKIMDEPAILKIDAVDQAVVIRDLVDLKSLDNNKIYLPGFSALHEEVGRDIAMANHSNDPYAFWTENYIKVAARALAELGARTGIQFDSPHSQNFLIELDSNYKPTGKLILRDMADLYLDATYIEKLKGPNSKLINNFSQKENIKSYTSAGFGPLHGNKKPSWVSEEQYTVWNDVFFDEYNKVLSRQLNIDFSSKTGFQNGDYFSANYNLTKNKDVLELMEIVTKRGYLPVLCKAALD